MPSDEPWEKLGVDLFTIANRDYLVTVDYFSSFWEIDLLLTTYRRAIKTKLKGHFARYEFNEFAAEYGIEHCTSSPARPSEV